MACSGWGGRNFPLSKSFPCGGGGEGAFLPHGPKMWEVSNFMKCIDPPSKVLPIPGGGGVGAKFSHETFPV